MKLKFELVNRYGVLVDESAEIKIGDFVLKNGYIFQAVENGAFSNNGKIMLSYLKQNPKSKIIFAEPELNLEGVPVFNWRDFEVENNPKIHDIVQDVILKEGKHWNDQDALEPVYYGVIAGYKLNPARYTKKDLKIIIDHVRRFGSSMTDDAIINEAEKEMKKYPKYVVMESYCAYGDECPSKGAYDKQHLCDVRLNLITNSQGKQEGIIKKIIWY